MHADAVFFLSSRPGTCLLSDQALCSSQALLGTFAGAAVWQTLENGLNMIGAQVGIQRVVIGVIVVAAVLLDVVVRNGQFGKHRKK